MEQFDSISMTLLDCVLQQAAQDRATARKTSAGDIVDDTKARRTIDTLLRRLASEQAQDMIDKRHRKAA